MPAYDINRPKQSHINFFNLAGRTTNLFEPEPLNAFDSFTAIVLQPEEPLEEYFWSEPQSVSPWNSYWTEATCNGGGLQIDNRVLKNFWTKYYGLHIDCQDQEVWYCKYNYRGTHSTIGRDLDIQSDSQATIQAQPKDEAVNQSWADHGARIPQIGKAVDNRKPGENLLWIPRVALLLIVTTSDNHNIFLW